MNLPTAGNITNIDIIKGVPEPLRHFMDIGSVPLPISYKSIIDAFWIATQKINIVVHSRKRIHVIFATAPFKIKLSSGELQYTPNPQVINTTIEDMIFLDCNKMMAYKFPHQVACILEEFVHALMNISDETLVSKVVAELYSDVKLKDGQYCMVEKQSDNIQIQPSQAV